MKEITIKNLGEREAEVLLYEEIGADMFGGGLTAKGFAERLDALGGLDNITVRINSPGGSVFDGTAIYNALVRHKAKVTVEIDGIAASAASFIAMAGDEIRIAENGLVMIHQAQGLAVGDAEEMTKMADVLARLDDTIAGIYASRTHRKAETWMRLMRDETWFTAEEAVKNRLADTVVANKKPAAANHFAPEVWSRLSKRPDKIAALLVPTAEDPPADPNEEDPSDGIESPLVKPDVSKQLAEYAAVAARLKF